MSPKERYEYPSTVPTHRAVSLNSNYSTSQSMLSSPSSSTSSYTPSSFSSSTRSNKNPKPDIHKVIFNDRFAMLNPTRDSDYKTNYLEPRKEDYRKKRTELFYPKYNEPSIEKSAQSEYRTEF